VVDLAVARRYAEALVNALERSRRVQEGLEELKFVASTYRANKDLENFLGSPEIAPGEKQALLHRLFADASGPEVMGLLDLLLKKERIDHLPAVSTQAVSVAEARQGILRGKIFTAHPISAAETEAVASAVGKKLGKKILLERQVDKEVMGGARVIVGTAVLDRSVATLLQEVRNQLIHAKVN